MQVTTIGIDLAKRVFHLVALSAAGREVWRKKLGRAQVLPRLAQVPACTVAMESCSGAHFWGREIEKLGHSVRLLAPQHVRVYVKGNKNDFNDAEAIAEAATRPRMGFVPLKNIEQQDIQALHRVRAALVKHRTAMVNQWRGLLAEYGIVLPVGIGAFFRAAPRVLEDAEHPLSDLMRGLLHRQLEGLHALEEAIAGLERQLQAALQADARAQMLLRELAGIGVLTATALVGAIGDGRVFRRGRELAAWLGLVPRQYSTGGKPRLLGISKRGDVYLRTLLIHGARAVVHHAARKNDPFSQWVNRLHQRRGANVAAVAVANKNARMAWALLRKQAMGVDHSNTPGLGAGLSHPLPTAPLCNGSTRAVDKAWKSPARLTERISERGAFI